MSVCDSEDSAPIQCKSRVAVLVDQKGTMRRLSHDVAEERFRKPV